MAPPDDQILNQSKLCHLVAKYATNTNGFIWWPNLLLIQVVQSGGQICNWCKWRHLVAKIATDAISAMLLSNLVQVTESISGSVVPLAMFIAKRTDISYSLCHFLTQKLYSRIWSLKLCFFSIALVWKGLLRVFAALRHLGQLWCMPLPYIRVYIIYWQLLKHKHVTHWPIQIQHRENKSQLSLKGNQLEMDALNQIKNRTI